LYLSIINHNVCVKFVAGFHTGDITFDGLKAEGFQWVLKTRWQPPLVADLCIGDIFLINNVTLPAGAETSWKHKLYFS